MTTSITLEKLTPKTFMVETILGCDLECPECAIGADMIKRKKGRMKFEQFKVIADKIKPYCDYLYLHIWGEPILNKDIFRMIEYASTFTRTNISTNGNALTEEKAVKLIESGVTDIIVSIDGFSQKVYEQYRVGGSATKALLALKMLTELNREHNNPATITPQYIVFKHNAHEMDLFREFCESLGLKAQFKAPYIRENSRYQNDDNAAFKRSQYQDVASLREAMSSCGDPREVFTILLDGSCVMCCYDHDGVTNYGNIFEQEALEIWNGPQYKQDRFDIISGKAPEYCVENCLSWTLCHPEKANAEEAGSPGEDLSIVAEAAREEFRAFGRRQVRKYYTEEGDALREQARLLFREGLRNEAFDIFEQLCQAYKSHEVALLAEVYDLYQRFPDQDRYTLYQSRVFDFGILPGDKVLDIGSGNIPFALATHLADITTSDHSYGRAGAPFKHVDGKPVYEVNLENTDFNDNEFDFVYCSHVLEHVENPERACEELMRIAKRGYIETPTRAKDLWLNTAKISNHLWWVEKRDEVLIFNEYQKEELEGIGSDVAMLMHVNPQSAREKAFSALIYLKPELMNTMLLWEDRFSYEVKRRRAETRRKEDTLSVVE